jgi:hypothetical protein
VTGAEAERDDFVFFGFVIGFESEWGYYIKYNPSGKIPL